VRNPAPGSYWSAAGSPVRRERRRPSGNSTSAAITCPPRSVVRPRHCAPASASAPSPALPRYQRDQQQSTAQQRTIGRRRACPPRRCSLARNNPGAESSG
jgi:hypothetical protein